MTRPDFDAVGDLARALMARTTRPETMDLARDLAAACDEVARLRSGLGEIAALTIACGSGSCGDGGPDVGGIMERINALLGTGGSDAEE